MNSRFRSLLLAGAVSLGVTGTLLDAEPARAADVVERIRLPLRGIVRPPCQETRPDHLLECAPSESVLILPDELAANSVYTLRSSNRPHYPQIFVWGP
jgi:hypothetical protein